MSEHTETVRRSERGDAGTSHSAGDWSSAGDCYPEDDRHSDAEVVGRGV